MAKTKRVKNWTPPEVSFAKDDPINTVQPESNMNRKRRRAAGGRPPGWLGKRFGQNTRILRRNHQRR